MSFESVFGDLNTAFDYFFSVFANFVYHLKQYPIVVAALIIGLSLPAFALIFDFISGLSHDSENIGNAVFDEYMSFQRKSDKIKKQTEFQTRKAEASAKAETFFKNNVSRMSVNIDGFKFYQPGFENKNWGNRKKRTTTTSYYEKNGVLYQKVNTRVSDSKDITDENDLKNET